MAIALGTLVLTAVGLGSLAGTPIIAGLSITYAALVGTTILIASTLAINYFLMATPKPSDGQQSLQQPIPFRRRIYGRVKVGGSYIFFVSTKSTLYTVLALASHEIDGIEEYWVGDRQVSLTSDGHINQVIAPPGANANQFRDDSNNSTVLIKTQLGGSGKTAYSNLTTAFPGVWTTNHVGYGVADALMQQQGVPSQIFSRVYPGGPQPLRLVLRGAKIEDPRSITSPATDTWTDNAVCVIRDYLVSQDGWRVPHDYLDTGSGLAATQAAANVCDEAVALASGGTEARYRIWGFYDFSDEPRAVLARMLAACGGWLQFFPDGTIGINAGKWVAPTVTIVDDWILGFEVQHFVGEFDAINEIRATFADPNNDYQDTESSPWDDDADISRRGYIKNTSIDARYCPSFTQTRRIQKIALAEANPEYTFTLTTNASGLSARGQRFVNLDITKLGLSLTCRITSFVADVRTGVCTIGLASFDSAAYDWTTAEEGPAPPIPPDTSTTGAVETPTNFQAVVTLSARTGSVQGGFITLSCDPPVYRTDLETLYDLSSDGGVTWTQRTAGIGSRNGGTGILPYGTYDARAYFRAPGGVVSAPAEIDGIVISATFTAEAVTGLNAETTNIMSATETTPALVVTRDAATDQKIVSITYEYRPSSAPTGGATTLSKTFPVDTTIEQGSPASQTVYISDGILGGLTYEVRAAFNYNPAQTLNWSGWDSTSVMTAGTQAGTISGQAPAATDPTVQTGATKNNTYYRDTDPASTSPTIVTDGDIWHDTATSKLYLRFAGSWVVVASASTMSDGDVIFDSSTPGSYSVPIPSNALAFVDIFVFGGGGGGGLSDGGGGSGYAFLDALAVTAGTSVLTVVVGAAGHGEDASGTPAATSGTSSSVTLGGTTVTGGGGGNGHSGAGTAGSGSGGTTNTTGEAGDTGALGNGGANLGTGNGGPTGGARQTTLGSAGNNPGGGGAAGSAGNGGKGGAGRVQILTKSS